MRRSYVALVLFALGTGSAMAADDSTRDDVMDNVARCAAIADNHIWLNCYYGAAQPMRGKLGLPPAPESQTALVTNAPPPPPPPMAKSDSGGWLGIGNVFGSTNSTSDGDFRPGVAMRLTNYTFTGGLFTVTLSDGEVWKQSPYDDLRAHWKDPAHDLVVMVTEDMMGSHVLRVKGDHDYRVMRIK
jgi:hypothetical protein